MNTLTSWFTRTTSAAYQYVKEHPKAIGVLAAGTVLSGLSALCSNASTTAAIATGTIALSVISFLSADTMAYLDNKDKITSILLTPDMTPAERVKITEALVALSAEEKEEIEKLTSSVVAQALPLLAPGMSGYEISDLLVTLIKIPVGERADFVAQALPLLAPGMPRYEIIAILKTLIEIPVGERADVVAQVLPLLALGMSSDEISDLLVALIKIPVGERADFVAQALPLLAPGMPRYEIIDLLAALPAEERQATFTHLCMCITPEMRTDQAKSIGECILSTPAADRFQVVNIALQLATLEMGDIFRTSLFEKISIVPAENRLEKLQRVADFIAEHPQEFHNLEQHDQITCISQLLDTPLDEELHPLLLLNGMAAAAAAGNVVINVHAGDRDTKTIAALSLLRIATGAMNSAEIEQGVTEFTTYLETVEVKAAERADALNALKGAQNGQDWGPLLGDPQCSSFKISGDEAIARHWKFANTFQDPKGPEFNEAERKMARFGMVKGLADCINMDGERVCNEGKVQRLVISTLQGRLPGVNIDGMVNAPVPPLVDEPAHAEFAPPPPVPTPMALTMFFNSVPNQQIVVKAELLAAAELFCQENPLVMRIEFLAGIELYAAESEIV